MEKRGFLPVLVITILIGVLLTISLVIAVEEAGNDNETEQQSEESSETQSEQTPPEGYQTEITLYPGKNYVELNQLVFVKDLVAVNPTIEAVSYYNPVEENTIGYVNAFGGLGRNFIMHPGTGYEIVVTQDTILYMPY